MSVYVREGRKYGFSLPTIRRMIIFIADSLTKGLGFVASRCRSFLLGRKEAIPDRSTKYPEPRFTAGRMGIPRLFR
jgi:hypothetical protein